jgi:hypothetical protein
MASINSLKASNGSENASVATIQSVRNPSATTIVVDTVQGIPASFHATMGTPHTFVDPVTSEIITVISEATAVDFRGHIDGTNLEIDEIAPGYTDNGSAVNDIVIIKPTTQWANHLAEVLEVSHQNNGSLKTQAVKDALGITTNTGGGWEVLNGGTPPTVASGYNKGNREFDLTFAGVNLTSVLSPGMRFRVSRTGTVPTQCTDLESSSSQFWQKTSPTGLSFTDDFTCEAWIKLESYTGSAQAIVTRFNGSSGFQFLVLSDGTIRLQGSNNGASNISNVSSYQSIPLGCWVHVAAKLDMSSFTYSNTTSQIYIDGVEVPGVVARGGTNPTSLVQAGNLEVGSQNGGNSYFDGKISDVRVWSTLRTTTQIRDNMCQQLVGNETNLVAYFKFNGNANDSTANANNLTAQGSATATNSDNPMKAIENAIITKVTYSDPNTIVTVFTGTNHSIPNMPLQNPQYSIVKTPYSFPSQSNVWTIATLYRTDSNQASPTAGTWYNVAKAAISIPTGAWQYGYQAQVYADATNQPTSVYSTLSTTNNSETNKENSGAVEAGGSTAGATKAGGKITVEPPTGLELTAQTQYYLNIKTQDASAGNVYLLGSRGTTIIYAKCAYA